MKRIKQTCALLLAIVLILGVVLQPGIGGVFADNTKKTEQITESAKEPATKSAEEPAKSVEESAKPAKEPETEPATKPAKEPETEPATKPAKEPETEPATKPAKEPETEPATKPATEQTEPVTEPTTESERQTETNKEPVVKSFYEQLMDCSSLTDLEDLLCAEKNKAALDALTQKELKQLLEHVEKIWTEIEKPTEADTILKEKLLKKLKEHIIVICPECGGENDKHKEGCSALDPVCSCGSKNGKHTEKCPLYVPPAAACPECGKTDGHAKTCSHYTEKNTTYPWMKLTDKELAAWLMDKDNADTVKKILNNDDSEEYDILVSRIDAILSGKDTALAEKVKEYLAGLLKKKKARGTRATGPDKYIYFDLAAGNVRIGKDTYTGYVFVGGEPTKVSDAHSDTNEYYIYQSNLADKADTGYETKDDFKDKINCRVPEYSRVKNGGIPWTKYIENNIDVYDVSGKWETAATDAQRTSTPNNITFDSQSNYIANVIIDNIWSNYHKPDALGRYDYRTSGGIGANLSNTGIACTGTKITLKLKGDNRVGCVHYSARRGAGNQIIFVDGESGGAPGSITVADFPYGSWKENYWSSAIGGADSPANSADMADGIVIESGVIYAGTTWEDNSTAIGGGGNDYGGVTISGGTVTAVAATTGTAIGGGIGWGSPGGDAKVEISSGTIYAYNFGINGPASGSYTRYVPAAAIGGGSSQGASGNRNTIVNISGGTVYAQSKGGAAIGGGSSATQMGGSATINISGGNIIAKSTAGTYLKTDGATIEEVDAGASIGGGTGNTGGGSVELNISGGIIRTGSIGGGKTKGTGTIGSADVVITDGDITGQVIMAGGASKNCTFTMSGGKIHGTNVTAEDTVEGLPDPQSSVPIRYLEKNGGAVWMDDANGITKISGDGIIEGCSAELGGAIYMTGGAFSISGSGAIRNNTAALDGGGVYVGGGNVEVSGGAISNNTAEEHGGGVYVGGGNVEVSGGAISDNTAAKNGGGMYVGNGDVDVSGGKISNNTATVDGGGAYIAGNYRMTAGEVLSNKSTNGGGIYVNDGVVTMYGGKVDSNTATESGGGMYISGATKQVFVDIFSGSISGNKSKTGGGISAVSESSRDIFVTVGVNCVHPDLADHSFDGAFTPFPYPPTAGECGSAHSGHTNHMENLTHASCPQVKNNEATGDGGAFFLASPKTKLVFYCIMEEGNIAHGNKQCYNLNMQGGLVKIGDDEFDPETSDPVKGNIIMRDSIFVEGGDMEIFGKMHNPNFADDITVDIKENNGSYVDHRRTDLHTHVQHYKVHYYENFKGDGDVPTGLYIARQSPDDAHHDDPGTDKYDFTIMSSIFSHPGYKIVGWNTEPDDTGTKYEVNGTYNFYDLYQDGQLGAYDSHGKWDEYRLKIYAIWERYGYVLKFDPNVSEGDTYTGVMENQRVTVGLLDGSQTIKQNQFKRTGYKFMGWTLNPSPTDADRVYADEEPIREDFTSEDGATVTLYAQWEICDHIGFLTYSADGNILTESCSKCGGHSATAAVSAVDSVYDGNVHLADVRFSANWLGDKPEISYEMAASEWDDKDTADEEWQTDPRPLHAGNYTAKVAIDAAAAKAEYKITPVKWETPEEPKITFRVETTGGDPQSIIEVSAPIGDNIEYWIKYLDSVTGTETALPEYPNWQKENQFSDISFGNYYYFYAKRCADRDHLESTPSQSEAYLADGGNIVYIENETGIKVVPQIGDDTFTYKVSADEGYHLRNYQDNADRAIAEAAKLREPPEAFLNPGGITIDKTGPKNGTYTYSVKFIKDQVAYHKITLKFSGAAKDASVACKVTDGQVFGNFNGKETSVSCDSAFTAQFTVSDYIPEEYATQALSFSKALPVGATVIMKTDGGYWYHHLAAEKSLIDLTDFIAMGATEPFEVNTTETSTRTFTYQFIVDFSQAAENMAVGPLGVDLKLTAKPALSAPTIPAVGDTQVSLDIEEKAVFQLASDGAVGKSAAFHCTYTPSAGAASIWNDRETALVLTAPSTVPADLTMTAVIDGNKTRYAMNANRQFIIPFGKVGSREVTITLNSCLFGLTAEEFAFTACWYVSQSSADQSPLNGYAATPVTDVFFSCVRDSVPSVRIDGTEHLFHAGEVLTVTVNYAGIPDGEKITAYLQRKVGGKYEYTGAKNTISDLTGTSEDVTFNMGQMDEGSYRILAIVQESGANILEVPYYFVIQ